MTKTEIKAMLEVMSDAGFRITLDKKTKNMTIITAVDKAGEVYRVRSDSDMEAVLELAHMLRFEDLD